MPILDKNKLSKLFSLSLSTCRSKLIYESHFTRQIHANNLNQSQLQNNKKKEHYYKSLLNDFKHKNVYLQNYRIAMTLIGKNDLNRKRISTALEAKQFINTLTPNERLIIKEELLLDEKENVQTATNNQNIATPTFRQLVLVCLQSGLPFIGFGFVDNFIMIIAGDAIESYLGVYLPISTMAAAGLGNALSDVGGIGLAHHIEYYCSKLIDVPKLTAEQWNKPIVGWCNAISKSLCIFIGCIIGMTPLLFMHHDEHKPESVREDSTT